MKRLGVIVNPVAGIGGRVGLKGSDGKEILQRAIALGAKSESPNRATEALKAVAQINDEVEVLTYPDEMGENECRAAGIEPRVLGSIVSGQTSPDDTIRAAKELVNNGAKLIMFAGGDGTARDIHNAVGESVPVLGIPAGVKIHSAVYAITARSAGEVARMYLSGRLLSIKMAEVMDIDEDAFRSGVVTSKLYGYLRVPEESQLVQNAKAGGILAEKETLQGIAMEIVNAMDESTFYLIGPGTTTRTIMEKLGLKNTLLGVDIVRNKQLVANDVTEQQILETIQCFKARILVTVIGGQGHVFGRGNQQLSPRVIRLVGKQHIDIIATKEKLASLSGRPLLMDTGDEVLNKLLGGYAKVLSGYKEFTMYPVGS
ncbi:MAG: ATP-NAD kinase [Lacunisphaera sp.]|nr:ATP-NAD kinase [Lacunisphaera sp.]